MSGWVCKPESRERGGCSLLLGRLGEPAVARLVERPLAAVGLPADAAAPIGFAGSLLLVVIAHMLLGEMVPRNIAPAGPERAALLLVPPFLLFTTGVRPAMSRTSRGAVTSPISPIASMSNKIHQTRLIPPD